MKNNEKHNAMINVIQMQSDADHAQFVYNDLAGQKYILQGKVTQAVAAKAKQR
jgi:hypothetical protein